MVKVTFYVGQTDAQGQPMQAVAQQVDAVQRTMLAVYKGFSMTSVFGGWLDPLENKAVLETSLVISALVEPWQGLDLNDNLETATEAIAVWMKGLFEQKSVLYTIEDVRVGKFV